MNSYFVFYHFISSVRSFLCRLYCVRTWIIWHDLRCVILVETSFFGVSIDLTFIIVLGVWFLFFISTIVTNHTTVFLRVTFDWFMYNIFPIYFYLFLLYFSVTLSYLGNNVSLIILVVYIPIPLFNLSLVFQWCSYILQVFCTFSGSSFPHRKYLIRFF